MKTKNNFQGSSGELNCIWMTSELVKYKLCDKEFDCENCEFDKVFRNLSIKMNDKNNPGTKNKDLVERLIKRIENENYDDKVLYLKNQLIMKNLFGNAYYLGINPVVHYLLDDFSYIHEFNSNEIKRDQIIFTLEGKWGIKQFISPINFMIIEKLNLSQFKLNQWYAVILFNEADIENFRISQEEWNKEKNTTLSILKDYIQNDSNGEVYTIKGIEGAGKTSLAYELFSNYNNVVLLGNNRSKSGIEFIKDLLKELSIRILFILN